MLFIEQFEECLRKTLNEDLIRRKLEEKEQEIE